ncbi:hypothetical protein OS493_039415 [Desmophyllum pertusum]|uniref:GIY-YIG domain-containing protein n=1 Tax=Desmophyllum pertusum TaxID=174260 RepID=A0A9X0CGS2_9CNID|nr:hypothetical protein OS493_039415 [Desmophyllum pertusum]
MEIYADELDKAPREGGIYAIGLVEEDDEEVLCEDVLYVGQSDDIRKRLGQHKSGNKQAIDKFVKKEFSCNGGQDLRIKWKTDQDHKCAEGEYLDCMEERLGYWPEYNMKRGNTCAR